MQAFGEHTGQAEVDGFRQPVTSELQVYVQSNLHVQSPAPQSTLGHDHNDGLSKDRPLLTLDGVRQMVARRGTGGARLIINLAGGGGADPWVDPTEPRYYLVRDVFVGGAEAFGQGWCIRGPRNMIPLQGGLPVSATVSSFAGEGLRTKWNTSGLGTTDQLKGYWVRVERDGVEVTQPVQVTGNTAVAFWTDNGPNTEGAVYETTDTFTFVTPGAELVGTNQLPGDTAAADGVCIQGRGAHEVYGRPNLRNPALTFERVAIERAFINGAGLSFDCVKFYNTCEFRGGWAEFHGCIVDCNAGLTWLSDSRAIASNGTTETAEFNGRALVDSEGPYPNGGDPLWPTRGGIGLYVVRGGMRIGDVHARGVFRVWKSLSVEGGIVVRGAGSALVQPSNENVLFVRNVEGPALWCRDGAQAFIDDSHGLVEFGNVSSHLKVGIGNAVALGAAAGAFREVGGWAGNLSRHLEVNGGGKPTGDHSRIADSGAWIQ